MPDASLPWINPIGGLGDALMLSGVLKTALETSGRRFNLVRRTKYSLILDGHPAIATVGHPSPDATIIGTDYWSRPEYAAGMRAYQVLALIFGLTSPVEERLYVAGSDPIDPLARQLPRGRRRIALCPSSDSPRKEWPWSRWEELARRLGEEGIAVLQFGREGDRRLRGTGNLVGLTTPRQAIGLLAHFDAVVCCDSFLMHAAHMVGVPAVVLWGPTSHVKYGYPGHRHLFGRSPCPDPCLGPGAFPNYGAECDQPRHCMEEVPADTVVAAALDALIGSRRECLSL